MGISVAKAPLAVTITNASPNTASQPTVLNLPVSIIFATPMISLLDFTLCCVGSLPAVWPGT